MNTIKRPWMITCAERLTINCETLKKAYHTLTLKAWDVYNNSSTAEIQFVVADGKLKITRVLNLPKSFVSYTEFWFNHNHPFEPFEVQVQVLQLRVRWYGPTTRLLIRMAFCPETLFGTERTILETESAKAPMFTSLRWNPRSRDSRLKNLKTGYPIKI